MASSSGRHSARLKLSVVLSESYGFKRRADAAPKTPVVYDSDDEAVVTLTADERASYERIARQRWASGASLIKDAEP
eukprot:680697-Prymnesium_polylepis.1